MELKHVGVWAWGCAGVGACGRALRHAQGVEACPSTCSGRVGVGAWRRVGVRAGGRRMVGTVGQKTVGTVDPAGAGVGTEEGGDGLKIFVNGRVFADLVG